MERARLSLSGPGKDKLARPSQTHWKKRSLEQSDRCTRRASTPFGPDLQLLVPGMI